MRRTLFLALSLALAAPLAAQQRPQLEPLPEPPPPPGVSEDAFEPEVTILKRGEDTVEEYRHKGRLYMVKVTPPHGVPYYLVDQKGDGVMVRQGANPPLSVPMWVLKSW
ncbi:MAG: DUF2782 domain-containing protein [Rhodocyclaceae bacterium]|jgi:Protein of unknown function (DUF2782).|nr:DUF2782 domain-containing protein [Rhodocyclaceae bacterium]MCL4758105.1 DUF2782 domain-containing protein [Rhodocyclaceae bacterium]